MGYVGATDLLPRCCCEGDFYFFPATGIRHRVDFVFSFSFGIQVKTRLEQTKLYPKILPPCFVFVLCEVCDTERGANTILTLSCLRQSLKTSLFCAFLTIVSVCIQNQPLTQGPEDFHSFWSISSFLM